jgi:hypothetical protein
MNIDIFGGINMKKVMVFFGLFTFIGITAYWITVFVGIFEIEEIIPGYINWYMSFSIADFWIAICSLLSSIFLLRNCFRSIIFGLLAGSGLIFLGLYALMYGINTGIIFVLSTDTIIEICIKTYCLIVGTINCIYYGKNIKKLK